MRGEIQKRLMEIERDQGVRIVGAVEAGSRAWGFESVDSDYDVRFVYHHTAEWYLRISFGRDTIERMDGEFDLVGWDLRKALALLRKSNPSLLEWLVAPAEHTYVSSPTWERMAEVARSAFSRRSGVYHYHHMARGNYKRYVEGWRQPLLKKYLYVIRPLLAAQWILERDTIPPLRFDALADALLPEELRRDVAELLATKRRGGEKAYGPPLPRVDAWIEERLVALLADGDMSSPGFPDSRLDRILLDAVGLEERRDLQLQGRSQLVRDVG